MEDLNDKVTGGSLTANEWNQVPSELQNVITAFGQSLTNADLNQLGKAIAAYALSGRSYTDSGTGSAYVLSPQGSQQAPPSYVDGAVYEFLPLNTNTGAATANIAGLGVKDIKWPGGIVDVSEGDITENTNTKLIYRASGGGYFQLDVTGYQRWITFASSGTYVKPAGLKYITITVLAAGAGGGTGNGKQGGGGGAGEAIIDIIPAFAIPSSVAVTVGLGGLGATGSNQVGNDGGNSSFGTLIESEGGGRGGTSAGGSPGNGGYPYNNATFRRGPGGNGSDGSASGSGSGTGGASNLGGGARGGQPSGSNAVCRGTGGGGGFTKGGNGADGYVYFQEHY